MFKLHDATHDRQGKRGRVCQVNQDGGIVVRLVDTGISFPYTPEEVTGPDRLVRHLGDPFPRVWENRESIEINLGRAYRYVAIGYNVTRAQKAKHRDEQDSDEITWAVIGEDGKDDEAVTKFLKTFHDIDDVLLRDVI